MFATLGTGEARYEPEFSEGVVGRACECDRCCTRYALGGGFWRGRYVATGTANRASESIDEKNSVDFDEFSSLFFYFSSLFVVNF